ncbi:MAG: TIGR04083 family peptide-modifying radical SAM enzyme [Rhodothermales bacterium]
MERQTRERSSNRQTAYLPSAITSDDLKTLPNGAGVQTDDDTLARPHQKRRYKRARRHLMLTPSLACQAECVYCFGPNRGSIMPDQVFDAAVDWIDNTTPADERVDITFHGGEPLIPGIKWYQRNLPILRHRFGDRLKLHLQSNLWLLDDAFCRLFKDLGVSLGTSLDGPEPINDAQRGKGYFRRTMAAVERARAHGMEVGCICTFTAQSASRVDEILDFFIEERLNVSIHVADPAIKNPNADALALSPDAHGALIVRLLDRYLENLDKIRISTLDALIKSVSAHRGGICTYGDCLGGHLTIGADGGIYLCQRYAEMPEYQFGNVLHSPSMETLAAHPLWRMFEDRQHRVDEECGGCENLDFCRGGCPYNVLAANGGRLEPTVRDPHCPAYKQIFSHIVDRAAEEVFSQENLAAVMEKPDQKNGLLRRGKLLSIMKDEPHPYEAAQHARRILAAVALADTGSPAEAARALRALGVVSKQAYATDVLAAMHRQLAGRSTGCNNLYLHVTFACNLQCRHCYSESGPAQQGWLSVDDVVRACYEAAEFGFRHVVVTGGEPLVHPNRLALLDALAALRPHVKPTLTVLRTSLALRFSEDMLQRIGRSTDEVVVSVDGNRETHDRRRGTGSYDLTVKNLRALKAMGCDTDLSLAAVLPREQICGAPRDAVRALADELGIRRVRFKPLLPLGRALGGGTEIIPETQWGHIDPHEVIAHGFQPIATCGMGQNLYVAPDGSAYPCYACKGEQWKTGTIHGAGGLTRLMVSPAFQKLGTHTVNTNRRCRACAVRYLCGGACRAWDGPRKQPDLDAPPEDCTHLHGRARSLLLSALDQLNISEDRWLSVGLPLPDAPPKV